MGVLSYDTGDPRTSVLFAQIILRLSMQPSADEIQADYVRFLGEPSAFFYSPRNGLLPAYVQAKHDEAGVQIMEGAYSTNQGLAYVNAIGETIDYTLDGGANSYIRSIANSADVQGIAFGLYTRPRTWIVGHSLGGIASVVQGARLYARNRSANFSVVTFGSAKPGPLEVARFVPYGSIERWMNEGDPVPLIPPEPIEAPFYYALRGVATRNNAALYAQPAGGTQLFPDGSVISRNLPNVPRADIQPALTAWLQSLHDHRLTEHSMQAYLQSLQARNARYPLAPPITGRTHSIARLAGPRNSELRRAEEAAVKLLREEIRDAGTPNVRIPPEKLFVARKNGSVWVVYFLGRIVLIGPSRKRCRAFASRANDLLRRLQLMAAVNTTGFGEELTEYLLTASDPLGGYIPVMREIGSI